jgi:hypothetical protein
MDHLDWYPGAHIARFDGREIEPKPAQRFMSEVDVVFSVETLYSWPFASALRNAGIHTVVQGNPEFYRRDGEQGQAPPPHQWVWPTDWLIEDLPPGPVLPVPAYGVAPVGEPPDLEDERLTFLHVAGHAANGDRNGTEAFFKALRHIRVPCRVRVVGQDGQLPVPDHFPAHIELDANPLGVDNRWDLYRGAHVLVAPRRYGGLSLPVIEALEMGLAVLMSDARPNHTWPILPIRCSTSKAVKTPFGLVPTVECRPSEIAIQMDSLSERRQTLHAARFAASAWLNDNSWAKLRPRYDEVLRDPSARDVQSLPPAPGSDLRGTP